MRLAGFEISRARKADTAPASRSEPPITRAGTTTRPDSYMLDRGWGLTGGSAIKHLPAATPSTAERHGTVSACCSVIAGDLSKVPLTLVQLDGGGKSQKVTEHPSLYLLNVESAPGVPAMVARFALTYAWLLRGNGYGYTPRDGGGELTMIDLAEQDTVFVLKDGRARFYDFTDGAGAQRRVASRSMLHLRYMAKDGWQGRSPITVAAESMGLALAGQHAAARTATGVAAKAVIKLDDFYADDDARKEQAKAVKRQITDPNSDGYPVMGPGEDIKRLDLSAADQELLNSRKFDQIMIAGIYRVPPSKLQILEYGVKANGQQQSLDYRTDCLLHWGGFCEAGFTQTLLTERERRAGLMFRHDYSQLLVPTTKELFDAYKVAVGGPFIVPNEARDAAGLGEVDGGDQLYPPSNMTRDESQTQEGQTDDT